MFDTDDDPLTVSIDYIKKFDVRTLGHSNYSVVLKDTLDRETQSRYPLQITINDGTVIEVSQVNIAKRDLY